MEYQEDANSIMGFWDLLQQRCITYYYSMFTQIKGIS